MKPVQIIQASGERAFFDEAKLVHSLKKAGAKSESVDPILKKVRTELYEGISTKQIYSIAFKLLRELNHSAAAKYKLKKALLELGPSGFVFEKYISEIFRAQGYAILLNQILPGACVTHEVDIIATQENAQCFIECKYHNLPGTVCDVKVPLYFHSRFRDLAEAAKNKHLNYQGWIVTNTKFTTDASAYGTCAGLKLLSWDFPQREGLKDIIDQLGLYPVTCLTTLTQKEKALLLQENILLCKSIVENKNLLAEAGIPVTRAKRIADEAGSLVNAVSGNKIIS